MRRVVPDQLQRFRVIARDDLDAGIRGDRVCDVGQRPVQADGNRLLRKRFRDRSREFRTGNAGLVFASGTVGKRQRNHGILSLPPTYAGKMLVMRPNVVTRLESQGSGERAPEHALDQPAFNRNRLKAEKLIDSNALEQLDRVQMNAGCSSP